MSEFKEVKIEVNKKSDKAGKVGYEKIGDVSIYVPLISAFGITAEQTKDDKGELLSTDDGLPVYAEDKANWLQDAILAAIKAMARNRLKPGTATLKDGAKIPSNFEELLAASENRNTGAALVAIRELKEKFKTWVAGLNKSAAAQQTLNTLFANKQALSLQSEANRQKMQAYITDFAGTLDEAMLAKGERYLQSLLDACATTGEAEDF